MKALIFALSMLVSSQVFAVAQADYQCGPYVYHVFGPYHTQLFSPAGEELGRWEGEDEGPIVYKGEQMYLKWDGRGYRCKHLGTTP